MKYTVNFGCFGSVFAVPDCVVDDYIKLASGTSLKVLLYILRNSSAELSSEKIAQALGINNPEIIDEAFVFWKQLKLLSPENHFNETQSQPQRVQQEPQYADTTTNFQHNPAPQSYEPILNITLPSYMTSAPAPFIPPENNGFVPPANKNTPPPLKQPVFSQQAVAGVPLTSSPAIQSPVPPVNQPVSAPTVTYAKSLNDDFSVTNDEISSRIEHSPEINSLIEYAENALGPKFNDRYIRMLIEVHDYYQLPVNVLMIIICLCISMDKCSPAYIKEVAADWSRRGIVTVDAASTEYELRQHSGKYANQVKNIIGLNTNLTTEQMSFINSWIKMNIPIELVKYAYDKTINQINKLSFNYMNKILCDWADKKLLSLEAVRQYEIQSPRTQRSTSNGYRPYNRSKDLYADAASRPQSYDLEEFERLAVNFAEYIEEDTNNGK